ncbi:hypothetical protein Tco_0659345 [Tanacetum coccineum]
MVFRVSRPIICFHNGGHSDSLLEDKLVDSPSKRSGRIFVIRFREIILSSFLSSSGLFLPMPSTGTIFTFQSSLKPFFLWSCLLTPRRENTLAKRDEAYDKDLLLHSFLLLSFDPSHENTLLDWDGDGDF